MQKSAWSVWICCSIDFITCLLYKCACVSNNLSLKNDKMYSMFVVNFLVQLISWIKKKKIFNLKSGNLFNYLIKISLFILLNTHNNLLVVIKNSN